MIEAGRTLHAGVISFENFSPVTSGKVLKIISICRSNSSPTDFIPTMQSSQVLLFYLITKLASLSRPFKTAATFTSLI